MTADTQHTAQPHELETMDGEWLHKETLAADLFGRAAELARCDDPDAQQLANAFRAIGLNLTEARGNG